MEWISKDMEKKVSGLRLLVRTARMREAADSTRGGRLRGSSFRRVEPIDRLAFVHQIQMIARDGPDVFGVRLEQLFLQLEMREIHAFIFDSCAQLFVARLGILALLDLGQERIADWNRRGKNDEREQEAIERMPDALSGMDLLFAVQISHWRILPP